MNEESNARAAELTDLPATDEQAQEAKGGRPIPTDQFSLNYAKII